MNQLLKQSFCSQLRETSETSSLSISPEKLKFSLPFPCLSPHKLTSVYGSGLNFPKEVQYLSFTPPSHIHYETTNPRTASLGESPAKTPEDTTRPLLSPGMIKEIIRSRNVITVNIPKRPTITTIDESIRSFRAESKTLVTLGLSNVDEQQVFSSIKISIGSFNSISTELSGVGKNPIAKSGTNSKKKCCSCKKSKCLKLYCECFANGTFCQGCNCYSCYNTKENESKVFEAKEVISEKNPFGLKRHFPEKPEQSTSSCNCSKSECLKKYCECFKSGKKCGTGCNCLGCKNNRALRTILYERCDKIPKKDKTETI